MKFLLPIEETSEYKFIGMSTEKLKKRLNEGDTDIIGEVPLMLEIGNLDIEVNVYNDDNDKLFLGYFCCRKVDGEWESYKEIDEPVNLDVPDIKLEMMRVLENFAGEQDLSFTDKGKRIFILLHCDEWKSRDSMRIVAVSSDYRELYGVIASEILCGDMGYKGEFYADGLTRFRNDYKKGKDDLSLLDYGFYEIYDESKNTRCLSSFLLDTDDKKYEQYISHYRIQTQCEVNEFEENEKYEPDDEIEQ